MTLREAAKRLNQELFGHYNPLYKPGFVGEGNNRIFVYIHLPRRQWHNHIKEFEGFPIEWKFNVGRAVAQ